MDFSVAVPLFNEEESIELLYDTIVKALETTSGKYEIIFVDDGSKDKTFEIAKNLANQDKRLKVIKFRKNYGQTPAMAAGIEHATGKIILTMDGDLQNDPSDIPNFLSKMDEGYDIVVGWRHNRQDKLITRKIPSKIANWLISKVTGVPIKDNGCSLKAYRASIIQKVPLYSEMHRFIPAMASIAGTKVAEIKVKHHARQFGESKYGLSRIYKVLLDLVTIKTLVSFSSRPLLWFFILGFIPGLIGLISIFFWLISLQIESWSSNIVFAGIGVLSLSLSVFLIALGMVGELIYKTGDFKVDRLAQLTLDSR